MALKGTIKDFGVADIFQLISQQAKTGVLVLSNDVDQVRVYFQNGAVVRAGHSIRTAEMLLGNLMVRARVISQKQLDASLKEQQRTLKRLGDILVEQGAVTRDEVREFATLQMTETLYGLFEWSYGTYEFESTDVEPSPEGVEPIRAETVVMNGIRMTDEWPAIRERIPSYAWQVERMRPLPPPEDRSFEDELDFSSVIDAVGGSQPGTIGDYERRVYELITPGQTVQQIIDRSRLGEFEAASALSTLMGEGYIRIIKPEDEEVERGPKVPLAVRAKRSAAAVGRMVVSGALVVLAALLLGRVAPRGASGGPLSSGLRFETTAVEAHVAEAQMRVIRRALEVYRYQTGAYPEALEQVVEAGLLRERDLRYPFSEPYHYRAGEDGVVLLPPVQ